MYLRHCSNSTLPATLLLWSIKAMLISNYVSNFLALVTRQFAASEFFPISKEALSAELDITKENELIYAQ